MVSWAKCSLSSAKMYRRRTCRRCSPTSTRTPGALRACRATIFELWSVRFARPARPVAPAIMCRCLRPASSIMCCLHITTLYQWLPSPPATCMLILCTLVVRSGLIEWQEFLVLMAVQLGGSESESESSESEEDQSPTNSPAGSPRYPAGAGAGVGVGLKEKASGAMGAAKTAGAAAAGAAATKLAGVMDDDDDDFANPLARPGLASRPAPAAPAPTPPLPASSPFLRLFWCG